MDNAPASNSSPAMAGIVKPANIFVLLRLEAEQSVDLVVQDRR